MKTNLKDPSSWIPKEVFEIYYGGNSKKLSDFYDKAVSKKNMMTFSLNWLAILIFPAWLGYRRQWLMVGFYIFLMSILSIIEAVFQFTISNSAFIGIGIALGMMANGLLLSSANQIWLKLKKEGLNELAIVERMKNQAQGSAGLAVVSFIICLIIIVAVSYLAGFVS